MVQEGRVVLALPTWVSHAHAIGYYWFGVFLQFYELIQDTSSLLLANDDFLGNFCLWLCMFFQVLS